MEKTEVLWEEARRLGPTDLGDLLQQQLEQADAQAPPLGKRKSEGWYDPS